MISYIDFFHELDRIFLGIFLKIYSLYYFILFFFGFLPIREGNLFKKASGWFESTADKAKRLAAEAAARAKAEAERFARYMTDFGNDVIKKIFIELADEMKTRILDDLNKYITESTKPIYDALRMLNKEIRHILFSLTEIPNYLTSFLTLLIEFFKNFGVTLTNAIVLPIFDSFTNLGTIFRGIIGCLMVIIQKIIDIPKCILVYAYYGAKGYYDTVGKRILPGWLIFIIEIGIAILRFAYTAFYYIVLYPLSIINQILTGQNMDKILESYWNGECMTINFNKHINRINDGIIGLVPKFKPLKFNFKLDPITKKIDHQSKKIKQINDYSNTISTLNDVSNTTAKYADNAEEALIKHEELVASQGDWETLHAASLSGKVRGMFSGNMLPKAPTKAVTQTPSPPKISLSGKLRF